VVGVALCVLAAGLAYGYVRYRDDQIARLKVDGLQAGAGNAPMTILLVGSNTRAGLDPSEAKAFGTADQVGGARSDVTMLVHLEPKTRSVSLLSIPRDLFVPVPGTTKLQRVDAALNQGPDQLVQVIQDDLGIPVNHYVELNFDTFQSVVNDLGGVDMYFPNAVRDSYSGLNLGTGCLHLHGDQALAVVRARHMEYKQGRRWIPDPYGDLSRIRRNHEFLRVLGGAVAHKGLANPFTVNSLIGSVAPNLKVDQGLSLGTMISLARRFRSVDPRSVPTATLPVTLAPSYRFMGVPYGDVVLPNEPLDQQVIRQFLGSSAPAVAPPATTPTLALVNQSGTPSRATTIHDGLQAAGYTVTTTSRQPVPARPAETVILYGSGKQPAALHLKSLLGGSVAMGSAPPTTGTDLELLIGTDVSMTAPSSTPPSTSPPSSAVTTAPTTAAPSHGLVNVGGDVVTVQETPQSFDPTACPPVAPKG